MKKLQVSLGLATLIAVGSCSELDKLTDGDLIKRADLIGDCFEDVYAKLDGLLQVAKTWQLNGNNPPNPAGLTHSIQADGVGEFIQVDFAFGACSLDVKIRLWDAAGDTVAVPLAPLDPTVSLSNALDNAGGVLRTASPPRGFITADWEMLDGLLAVIGSGTFTGLIGGTDPTQNELELIYTSLNSSEVKMGAGLADAPQGPAQAVATITTTTGSGVVCETTLNIPGLPTDEDPNQDYPGNGTVTIVVTEPGNVSATVNIIFDKSATAVIDIVNTASGTVLLDPPYTVTVNT